MLKMLRFSILTVLCTTFLTISADQVTIKSTSGLSVFVEMPEGYLSVADVKKSFC